MTLIRYSLKTLHLISHPEFFAGELEHIITILKTTEVVFHLRKPEASEAAYEAFVRQIPESYYQDIVLHSAYHLVHEFDFAGVHFSTTKRKMANNIDVKINKSTSCHSLMELKCLSEGFYSCFLSPVYPSISKVGYAGDLDLKEVQSFLSEERCLEVIALGGIEKKNSLFTLEMGFDSVAVLGAVWGEKPCREDHFVARVLELVNTLKGSKC